ncbi:MAG: TPM domain-containing protein [Bacteroidales bacterium]|nr:TPM domain-containing protein [Bacteroidales bacterium]
MLKKRFCLVLAIILIGVTGFAQKIPARPVPPRLVNDFANILSDKEEYALETKLVNYNDTTSTQICVVTVTSLDGTTSDDFAQKLGEKWGVGTKDNNGVVILVKPKTADELGDVSIQVGYGMEPYITDAVNYVIRTKEMIPAFKEGDYYTGIDNAVDAIIGLASGAFTAEEYADKDGDALGILVIFLAIIVVIVLISSSGKGKGGRRSSGFWNGFFLGSMFSGGGGSSWGSGGGSWGGGHGGSFGGFGGGHFGGGGGSSKW